MSGDDFGITVYNDTAMKTISVLIVFTYISITNSIVILFPPVNSDGD